MVLISRILSVIGLTVIASFKKSTIVLDSGSSLTCGQGGQAGQAGTGGQAGAGEQTVSGQAGAGGQTVSGQGGQGGIFKSISGSCIFNSSPSCRESKRLWQRGSVMQAIRVKLRKKI